MFLILGTGFKFIILHLVNLASSVQDYFPPIPSSQHSSHVYLFFNHLLKHLYQLAHTLFSQPISLLSLYFHPLILQYTKTSSLHEYSIYTTEFYFRKWKVGSGDVAQWKCICIACVEKFFSNKRKNEKAEMTNSFLKILFFKRF